MPTIVPASICNSKHHSMTYNPAATDNPTSESTIVPTSSCDPIAPSKHLPNQSPPTALPQNLLFIPPVEPSHVAHDLFPSTNKQARPTAPTAPPQYNIIDPDDNHHDRTTTQSSTPPWHSTCITYPCMPGNISIQVMQHVMTLKAITVATYSQ